MSYGRPSSDAAWASWADATAYTRPDFDAADAEWMEPTPVEARTADVGPLGAAAVVARATPYALIEVPAMLPGSSVAVTAWMATFGHVLTPNIFGAANVLAAMQVSALLAEPGMFGVVRSSAVQYPAAISSDTGPLGAALVVGYTDYTEKLDRRAATSFVVDFVTPDGVVRVPVSSWQATLQTEGKGYAQCVVPGAFELMNLIQDATEFVVSQVLQDTNGGRFEVEMVRAPSSTFSVSNSANKYTTVVSGYFDAVLVSENPDALYDRVLTGVEQVFTSGITIRVRCKLDPVVVPGIRAYYGEVPFIVTYVNHYVDAAGASMFMDVGGNL